FSSRRRHTSSKRDWSSDVCSSDLDVDLPLLGLGDIARQVMASVEVDSAAAADLGHGKQVPRSSEARLPAAATEQAAPRPDGQAGAEQLVAALDGDGRLCAMVRAAGERWRPQLVIPPDARC